MPRNNSKARQDKRQGVAEANTEARAQRSPVQQVEVLDKRLGANVGAVKERDFLAGSKGIDLTRKEDKAIAKATGKRTARRSK